MSLGLSVISSVLVALGGVVAILGGCAGLYKFYLAYISKKIVWHTLSSSLGSLEKPMEISISLENKSHSSIYVRAAELVMDETWSMSFDVPEKHINLKPGVPTTVTSGKFTKTSADDLLLSSTFLNFYLILRTTRGRIIVGKKQWFKKRKNEKELSKVGKIVNRWDGEIVAKGLKYVLYYNPRPNEEREKVFIDEKGYMHPHILGHNWIPFEQLESKEKLTQFLKDQLGPKGLANFEIIQPFFQGVRRN